MHWHPIIYCTFKSDINIIEESRQHKHLFTACGETEFN